MEAADITVEDVESLTPCWDLSLVDARATIDLTKIAAAYGVLPSDTALYMKTTARVLNSSFDAVTSPRVTITNILPDDLQDPELVKMPVVASWNGLKEVDGDNTKKLASGQYSLAVDVELIEAQVTNNGGAIESIVSGGRLAGTIQLEPADTRCTAWETVNPTLAGGGPGSVLVNGVSTPVRPFFLHGTGGIRSVFGNLASHTSGTRLQTLRSALLTHKSISTILAISVTS